MEETLWSIAGYVLAAVCVYLGVQFAINAAQAYRNQNEQSIWVNVVLFFLCFGIAYRNQDFVEWVKTLWDKIPMG